LSVERAEVAAKLEALRAAADVGVTDIQRGAYTEFSEPRSLESYLKRLTDEFVERARPTR